MDRRNAGVCKTFLQITLNFQIGPPLAGEDALMGIFICSRTKLRNCSSLGDQVRVIALRRGEGWSGAREDLANIAEEWFGRAPAKNRDEMRSVCGEVFRTE
ncbi:hypothetical protein [Pseudomonas sp. NFPP07]|uniref:hypothetical protein n=1 Tax=Pseudomonas sp. NFPP07 TaxID=1566213 RepID=UPI000B811063|nr:hypothetical protein [Pseudomonas sp. NFPP07]